MLDLGDGQFLTWRLDVPAGMVVCRKGASISLRLRRRLDDPQAWRPAVHLLERVGIAHAPGRQGRHDVLEMLHRLTESGRLVVVEKMPDTAGSAGAATPVIGQATGGVASSSSGPSLSARPPAPGSGGGTSAAAAAPFQDPPIFPDDVDQACLAESLAVAAQTGIPFCEECRKAAGA